MSPTKLDTINRLLAGNFGLPPGSTQYRAADESIDSALKYMLQNDYKTQKVHATDEQITSIAGEYMTSNSAEQLFNETTTPELQGKWGTPDGDLEIEDVVRRVMLVKRKNAVEGNHKKCKAKNEPCPQQCHICHQTAPETGGTSSDAVSDGQEQEQHNEDEADVEGDLSENEVELRGFVQGFETQGQAIERLKAIIMWQVDREHRTLKRDNPVPVQRSTMFVPENTSKNWEGAS